MIMSRIPLLSLMLVSIGFWTGHAGAQTGIITTIAGTGVAGYSGDGGAATSAMLYYPLGMAVDAAGNVYTADEKTCRVRKIDANGVIRTIAGNGTCGFAGDGGHVRGVVYSHSRGRGRGCRAAAKSRILSSL